MALPSWGPSTDPSPAWAPGKGSAGRLPRRLQGLPARHLHSRSGFVPAAAPRAGTLAAPSPLSPRHPPAASQFSSQFGGLFLPKFWKTTAGPPWPGPDAGLSLSWPAAPQRRVEPPEMARGSACRGEAPEANQGVDPALPGRCSPPGTRTAHRNRRVFLHGTQTPFGSCPTHPHPVESPLSMAIWAPWAVGGPCSVRGAQGQVLARSCESGHPMAALGRSGCPPSAREHSTEWLC